MNTLAPSILNDKRQLVALILFMIGTSLTSHGDEPQVDYLRDIRPIFVAHCFRCHGPNRQESELRLDLRRPALEGGSGGGVIVAGKSRDSELIRRVCSPDESERMPPKGSRLSSNQIKLVRRWIDEGAEGIPVESMASSKHWAFSPIRRPLLPAVSDSSWTRNAIDRFVLAKLEARDLAGSPQATRETLIRRVYLDLIGLPPPWLRVVAFVDDTRPNAYEQLVDELLTSPYFGERWGRHWLDLARHTDSTGYEADQPRATWSYRDWVIWAINADMPFDQFVREQLGGDLLSNATIDQRIATGFHCNSMLDSGVRHESVLDRVNTTGAVFLGITTGCAQCHAHKTDPLKQREFYQLYAFFNDARITEMRLDGSFYVASSEEKKDGPKSVKPPTTLVMKQTPQPTHIFIRGDSANPGERVVAAFPQFLDSSRAPNLDSAQAEQDPLESQLNRLDLADWLLSTENPLTARVTVNRVWQRFFGLGIVETESDFGRQTPAPLHRELLDHLAVEMRGGTNSTWRGLKSLCRQIATSATYRQSSNARGELSEDPDNRLLARQCRLRLEAEIIRDVTLVGGGLLCNKIGGPSVFPYQADGILNNRATSADWRISDGEDRYRRGIYTWVWRLTPYPNLPLFDAPDGVTACTRRDRSNVPVQALTLLNDPSFVEAARASAARIATSTAKTDDERITWLIRTGLSREPSPAEMKVLQELVKRRRRALSANKQDAVQISGNLIPANCDPVEFACWVIVSRVVMNLDEFITRE